MLDCREVKGQSFYSSVQSIYTVSYTVEKKYEGDTDESPLMHIEGKGPTRAEQ